ncbi:hypothetical protein CTAYLR_008446 [Chrysophaeum taylorii]|uniref:Deacetylase sirtuin-type domain-containing protein n=1 Tax=Chrysophaeum taylorii TaxID=2483200 RepID=A0AAD7UJX1_9STRA|nr:hypothetical protein CTAYLR_008446 [Chrysophaeum taylorii]
MRPVHMSLARVERGLRQRSSPQLGDSDAARALVEWLGTKRSVVALTGAGVSTGSGIPDYRGPQGSYRHGHRPMSHDEFLGKEENRARYWARALHGYSAFAAAEPNAAHFGLARIPQIAAVITQNVDGLHERVGTENVVALHGRGDRVRCMSCDFEGSRAEYHARLRADNPQLEVSEATELRPDADADVAFTGAELAAFRVSPCERCGSVIKPDVVFFGDVVPRARVDKCFDYLDKADGLLVAGSSLAVYSAFRFVDRAHKTNLPICVLNLGPTRADVEGIPITKVEAPARVLRDVAGLLMVR